VAGLSNEQNIFFIILIITPIVVAFISSFKSYEILKNIKVPGTLFVVLGDIIAIIIVTITSMVLKCDIDATLKKNICFFISQVILIVLYIAPFKILVEISDECEKSKYWFIRTDGTYYVLVAAGNPFFKYIICIDYAYWLEKGEEIKINGFYIFFIIANFIVYIIVDIKRRNNN